MALAQLSARVPAAPTLSIKSRAAYRVAGPQNLVGRLDHKPVTEDEASDTALTLIEAAIPAVVPGPPQEEQRLRVGALPNNACQIEKHPRHYRQKTYDSRIEDPRIEKCLCAGTI